ncbi:ATP-binding protein [Pseudobacteriovorax antillogorgiicola]|nr:ATP-binding protein [Pseudobacteriovorax antillogorgiicola]
MNFRSISKSVSLWIFTSIVVITILSLLVAGVLISDRFHERSRNSSLHAAKITELSLNQYLSKIVSGIDAINNDIELSRDTLLSLASPNPRRTNFYRFLYRINEFGKQYGLHQVSVYLKPVESEYQLFGAMDNDRGAVFSYPSSDGKGSVKKLKRDEYGYISGDNNFSKDFRFKFPIVLSKFSQNIEVQGSRGRLYLSLVYPLINKHHGVEEDRGQFLVKGMKYGFIKAFIPMPETFLSQLEDQTGLKISFFDFNNKHLAGINETYSESPHFSSTGIDGIEYLHYFSPILLFDKKIAIISTSLPRSTLIQEIVGMLAIVVFSIAGNSIVVLHFLRRQLRRRIVMPIKDLSNTANMITDGHLSEWQNINIDTTCGYSNEIDLLKTSFRSMTRRLETLINEKIKNIESILQNIEQGIFSIKEDGTIHHEYSCYLETIFPDCKISGQRYDELLFATATITQEKIAATKSAVTASLGNDSLAFEINREHLIHELNISRDGKRQLLELEWSPIIEEDIIQKIMVTVRDVTELIELREESKSRAGELSKIEQLIVLDHPTYTQVHLQSAHLLEECTDILASTKVDPEDLDQVFMNLHTAKGLLRLYGLRDASSVIHTIEDRFKSHSEDQSILPTLKVERLSNSIQEVIEILNQYKYINDVRLNRSSQDFNLPNNKIEEIRKSVNQYISDTNKVDTLIEQITESLMGTQISLESQLIGLMGQMEAIARELGKETPVLKYSGLHLFIKKERKDQLDNIFTHLLRNTIDHGIEGTEERKQARKSVQGTIFVRVRVKDDYINLEYCDDGRGISIEDVRLKKESNNKLSNLDVANSIFEKDLSTAKTVTDISGRGVGLSAVKADIESFGGRISVVLAGTAASGFTPFKFVIELPIKWLSPKLETKNEQVG